MISKQTVLIVWYKNNSEKYMYDEMSHFYTGIILTIKLNDSYIHNCRICKKYDILPINEIIYLYE